MKAANGTDFPYLGWIELEFKLMSGVDVKNKCAITVPFLVSPSEEVNFIILGFNVIEEMLNSNDMNDKETAERNESLSYGNKTTKALVNLSNQMF